MRPDNLRTRWGFATLGAATIALSSAAPAVGQSSGSNTVLGLAPLAVAIGAGAFGMISLVLLKSWQREGREALGRARNMIAAQQAQIDKFEQLLSGTREVTVVWSESGAAPKLWGQVASILPPGQRPDSLLHFSSWLTARDAEILVQALEDLRVKGQGFDLGLSARDGRTIRAVGWVLGGDIALRVRPAFLQAEPEDGGADAPLLADLVSTRAVLAVLHRPAWIRDDEGTLVFANGAYHQLARSLGKRSTEEKPAEVLDAATLRGMVSAIGQTEAPAVRQCTLGDAPYELTEVPVPMGRVGYFKPLREATVLPSSPAAPLGPVISAIPMPVAVFGPKRELIECNPAYLALWDPEGAWLAPGLDERTVLDRLRAEGLLPSEIDYKEWRKQHLEAYGLKSPRVSEPWHLPGGRILKVTATPIGNKGGVIYTFEDMTGRLQLESLNKALSNVQRETLNALTEGVAAFGTNARLTLHNPRFSALWKLPINELDKRPHIDAISKSVAKAMPEDGEAIWKELKRGIVDLNPTRADTSGRITRADGRLLDYTLTRLPDGQTMMTFLDVTESANFSRVLKERNDALVTADRLKDAFVQNVSYELRSPLTNIIGFADLLASDTYGPLNEKQRAYTDYIRASSTTLGVLIDNILDLTSVDAGITELNPEPQDLAGLVEKARAGLAETFIEVDRDKRINLVITIAPNLPSFVADGTRIVQILYNLLSNAARFSEPGGEVRLSVFPREERMLFVVEDEGPPMSEEMKAAIIDRIDTPSLGARQRAAGLGLAIVKTFVNLHGGTISLEARRPRGTRITVNLPRDASMLASREPRQP